MTVAIAVGTYWAYDSPESSALTPAWYVQVVDVSNPRMPEVSSILRQERELSQQIANEQGPTQTLLEMH